MIRHHRHRHPARQAVTSVAAVRLATTEGNVMRRRNIPLSFRARTYKCVGRRYGKFFVGPFFSPVGLPVRRSSLLCDRFYIDNMKREIYKYSFKHR